MAYDRQEQRIIPSGLNLLPPGDKIAPGSALDLTGWRPGHVGSLKMRAGRSMVVELGGSGGAIRAIYTVGITGGRRTFICSGGTLYTENGIIVETGYDGQPPGIVGQNGWAWIMNRSGRRRHNGTAIYPWSPAAPTVVTPAAAAAGGSLEAGDYDYYATTTTADGFESNPTPVNTVTVAASGKVTMTKPGSTDSTWLTGWHVYRKSPTLGSIYRVNASLITWATGTYVDTGGAGQTDNDLQDRDIVLERDHDPAPAASGVCWELYNGRIIAFSTAANPNRLFYTEALKPWYFPASNYMDVGDTTERIMAVVQRPGFLTIYKEGSIWRHVGDMGSGTLERVSPHDGVIGLMAIDSTPDGDYFQGRHGVYLNNGDRITKLTQALDPLFRGEYVYVTSGYSHAPLHFSASPTYKDRSFITCRGTRVYWGHFTTGQEMRCFVYDTEAQHWHKSEWHYDAGRNEGDYGRLLLAQDYAVLDCEGGSYDVPSTLTHEMRYQSRYEDQGLPEFEKSYAELVLDHTLRGTAAVVKVYRNNGAQEYGVATVTGTARDQSTLSLKLASGNEPIKARNLSVRVEINGIAGLTQPVEIHGIWIRYYVEAPWMKTFDSDEIKFADVNAIDWLEFDIEAPTVVSIVLRKALPGEAMASAFTGTIAATSGRQPVRVVVNPEVEGMLARLTLESTTHFRLYNCRMRVRAIGEHHRGAAGDVFRTVPIALGTGG